MNVWAFTTTIVFGLEVKQRFKRELTDFEMSEVQKYKEIFYLGLGKQRKNRTRIKRSSEDQGRWHVRSGMETHVQCSIISDNESNFTADYV